MSFDGLTSGAAKGADPMGRRIHPLSQRNRARLLRTLQEAAEAGSVPAAAELIRLSLLKEPRPEGHHSATAGPATIAAPGTAAAA